MGLLAMSLTDAEAGIRATRIRLPRESCSAHVLAAFAMMLTGRSPVQPRPHLRVAPARPMREDGADRGRGGGPL